MQYRRVPASKQNRRGLVLNPAIAAVISGVIALVVGLLSGYLYRKNVMENKIGHKRKRMCRIF